MDRCWYTIAEAAETLGRIPDTIKHWLQQGRIKANLFLVHGGKVRRVIMAKEVRRVLANEIPEIGTRPNSQAQKLWNRVVAHGKAGAKAKAKKKAERSGPGPAGNGDPKGESQGRNV